MGAAEDHRSENSANLVFGSVEMTCAVVGILLNAITLPYFARRVRNLSNALYTLIIVTDMLTSLTCIPSAVSMLHDRQPVLLGNSVLCSITGFIFNITSRMSVFLIAVLSVARAISISLPFARPLRKSYSVIFGVYLSLNITLASLPLLANEKGYHFASFAGYCSWGISSLTFINSNSSTTFYTFTYTTIILPWLVPGLVVSLSTIVSIYFLLKSGYKRLVRATDKKTDGHARSATITILIMTFVYIAFNTPCWVLYITVLSNKLSMPRSWLRNDLGLYLNIFVSRLSAVMNAAVNPLVYFTRISALRTGLSEKGHSLYKNSVVARTMSVSHYRNRTVSGGRVVPDTCNAASHTVLKSTRSQSCV